MAIVKRIGWVVGVTLASAALLAIVAFVFLNTSAGHRYILRLVIQNVQEATGASVEIASLSFHHGRPGVDFNQVVLRNPQADLATPLFSADRVGIGIGLHFFRSPMVAIQDVTLDHPVVRLTIDSQGNSNLPHASGRASGPSTTTNMFDLAIGHFLVNRGEFFYNDRRVPVTADIHDLNARAAYEVLKRSYDATLSYRDGQIGYAAFAPLKHNLDLSFSASASGVALKSLVLRTANSSIQTQGKLTNYEAPTFEGTYQASVSAKELTSIAGKTSKPSDQIMLGQIDTKGTLSYRSAPGEQAFNNLSISGSFSSRTLQFDSPNFRAAAQNLTGDFVLKEGGLEVRKAEADTMGGHVTTHLIISRFADQADGRLEATVQGIAMPALRDALRAQELPGVRADGQINGDLHATWHGGLQDLQLISNAQLAGAVSSTDAANRSGSFPFDGTAQVAYDGPKQIVTVHNAFLKTPHSHLDVEGSLGNKASLTVEARSEDLEEVDLLAQLFKTSRSASRKEAGVAPQLVGLGGTANFTGTVNGTLADPHFSGALTAANLRVHNASVQSLRASIVASSQGIAVHQGEIRNGAQTRASFDISVGLHDWSFTPEQPVSIRLNAEKVSLADLEHMAGFQFPIRGILSTTMNVTGTEENPQVQGTIQVTQANFWQQPIQTLSVALQNSGSRLTATVNAQSASGIANGTIAYDPHTREYDLQADLANVQLNQVQYLQEHAPQLAGIIRLTGTGRGNLASPQLNVTIDAQQLQYGDQILEGFHTQAGVAQQRANFDIACNISGAALRSQGAVNLTGDYDATAKVDSQMTQLGPLLQTLFPQAGPSLRGQTEFHATLKGPLKNPDQLQAQIEIPSFQIGYPSMQLASTGPIHADYQHGVVNVARTELKGTGTDVTLQARIPLRDTAPMRVTADGKLDLQLLQIWNPQWRSSGQLNLQIGVQGTRSHPELNGTVAVADGGISIESMPTLEKVKGELNLTSEAIQIKTLTGKMGGGDFEVHGSATYRPGIRYNLGMTTKDVRLLYPDGVRTQLTGALNLNGDSKNSSLTGQVTIDRLSLLQSFDLSSLSDAFSSPTQAPSGFAQTVKLNIALNSKQELELASSQLSLAGTANLQVRGTLAEPVLIGRTNLTGGEFFFNGRRFTVENASIEFANPVRTAPTVNLTATTIVNQFNLTVNLVGPFDRLRTTYTSDPPLAPVDVINLLITGQTTEAAQSNAATPQTVLAGQLASQVSGRLQKLTGISSLTIDPQIGGNQGNGASQLAIQERVTKNLFFTFATDVTTTQGQVVQVEYQITKKYSMSAIRNQTGGYEVEIKSHKTF